MSIRIVPLISNLNTREHFSTIRQVSATKGNGVDVSDCCFLHPNCDWTLPAIADLTDQVDYKNDRKDFIIKVANNSTVTGTLVKIAPDGTETSTVVVDNTYGVFFALGVLKVNVWGFILDWRKVAGSLGFGKYKFNITVLNSTAVETFNNDSVCFQLIPYSCENTHRTVRIDTLQGGYFVDGFDYTGLTVPADGGLKAVAVGSLWPQSIRLWGRFHRAEFELEVDNIVSQDRGEEQVQSRTVKVYNLQLDTIETKLSNPLIRDMLQAPFVYISDYNTNNIELYKRTRVTMTEIGSPVTDTLNKNEFMDIKFTEFFKANVHRYK